MERPVYWIIILCDTQLLDAYIFPTRDAREKFIDENPRDNKESYRTFEYFVDEKTYWIDENYFLN